MANDAPSHLPPVLRPDDPPVHSLEDLAERFALETRGDLGDLSLTGLTLATADLRPGDAFVAVRGVNRHGAEFAAVAAEKGAVAVVTDAAGAGVAASTGLPVIVVEDPRALLGELSAWVYGTGRDDRLPILFGTTAMFLEKLGLESVDDLPAIAEFIPGPDVVEALEHGLRVTPEIDVTTTGAPDPERDA